MTDIVERLRDQGRDAFAKHYSLGTFKLCDEAAKEIEMLREKLIERVEDGTMWFPIATKPPWTECEERGLYTHDGDGLFYFKATHWRPSTGK